MAVTPSPSILLALVIRQFAVTGQLASRYWSFFLEWTTWRFLLQGLLGTVQVAATAGVIALVLGLDATSSMSPSHSGTTFHFALGPDAPHLPTFYPDGDMDVSGSKSYVLYGREGYQNVLSVCRDPDNSVFWYRDAWGGRYRVVSEFSISYDAKQYMRFDVSARITEVVWEDPL